MFLNQRRALANIMLLTMQYLLSQAWKCYTVNSGCILKEDRKKLKISIEIEIY